jgi:hypothetical protein
MRRPSVDQEDNPKGAKTMNRHTALAYSGIGFAVLTAAAFLTIGPIPRSDAAVATITAYYGGHHEQLYLGGILLGYAAILLAAFGVAIWDRIRCADRHPVAAGTALAGTAVAAAGQLAAASVYVVLGDLGGKPGITTGALQALHALGTGLSLATAGGVALLLLAVAAAGIPARVFPRWLAWPALLLGIGQLVIPVSFTAFLLTIPWAIAASIALALRPTGGSPGLAGSESPSAHTGHPAATS